MKIVKEHINEVFTQDSDPIQDMGIGIKDKIQNSIDQLKSYFEGRGQFKLSLTVVKFQIKNGKKIIFKVFFNYNKIHQTETINMLTELLEHYNLSQYVQLPGKIRTNYVFRNKFLGTSFFIFNIKPECKELFKKYSVIYER